MTVKKVSLSKFEYYTGFHVTRNCSGKMEGMWALNTSAKANPLCKAMAKREDYICHKCYAMQFLGYRKSCASRFEKNLEAVNSDIFEYVPDLKEAMFMIKDPLCRAEEMGDVSSVIHAVNYMLIIAANPDVTFGWWTKHPKMIVQAMTLIGLDKVPDNLSLVGSSRKMNQVDSIYKGYPIFDHVFTVYRGEYAEQHDVDVNCGSRNCFACRRCYRKDSEFYINEVLKSDQKKKKVSKD